MREQHNSQVSPALATFMRVNAIASLKELLLIPDEVLVEMPGEKRCQNLRFCQMRGSSGRHRPFSFWQSIQDL